MEKSKRARKRKPDTRQGGPAAANLQFPGGQGVHCEVESEGHEEKCRAVIDEGCLSRNSSSSDPESPVSGADLWQRRGRCAWREE